VHRTIPTGISNDAMGSVPHHPFFLRVIEALSAYDKNWQLPYITVMYSTGPLFLSVIWKEYMNSALNVGDGRVRVLSQADYNHRPASFFKEYVGSSWHGRDARLIFWMGAHWMLLTATGFLVAGVVGLALWWAYGRLLLFGSAKTRRGGGQSKWAGARRIPMFWRRTSANKQYELIDRHEV